MLINWRDEAEIYSKYLISFLSRQASLLWCHLSINLCILARDQTKVIISVLLGVTSLLYVTLLIYFFFFYFVLFLSTSFSSSLPWTRGNAKSDTYLRLAAANSTELWGIYLYSCHKTQKNLKRTVSTKESANQRTSLFLWGWWPILPFLCGLLSYFFCFFFPNYILSVDNFAQFEVGCGKLARTGGAGDTGRKK